MKRQRTIEAVVGYSNEQAERAIADYMRELGRRGGRKVTTRKSEAARKNLQKARKSRWKE